jgi:HD superfamily phosphodiesterase
MDLAKIKQIAYDEMSEKVHWSGEKRGKYYHGERTAKIALALREHVLPNDTAHDEFITVAGWFHDCMHGEENHALVGAERAKILLSEHCTADEMREIYDIMYRHDDRLSDRAEFSVYAKIQQDADLLDHFGTYDIWTVFVYSHLIGRDIVETIEHYKEWAEKLSKEFEKELNFDVSKKIYRERVEFTRRFTERFSVEGTGGIWSE